MNPAFHAAESSLHGFVESTHNHFFLLLARELVEIHRIARCADGEIGVHFGVFKSVDELLAGLTRLR